MTITWCLNSATSVETGAGDDTINLSGNSEDVSVNAGAGDDRIELGLDLDLDRASTVVKVTILLSTEWQSSHPGYDAINGLQNIETLEFSADSVTVDASELDASALSFTGTGATVDNLAAEQTAIVRWWRRSSCSLLSRTLN